MTNINILRVLIAFIFLMRIILLLYFNLMLVEEKALTHWIDNFYGYGSWDARLWFIGYDEDGGKVPEEVAEKINYFQNTHVRADGELCDIRELYKHVAFRWDGPKASSFSNMYEYRFDDHATQNTVWKNLIAFQYGYKSRKIPNLLAYQQHEFLSPSKPNEALIQLYPLPVPHNHGWYYSWLDLPDLSLLKSRARYEAHVYERRIHKILSKIDTHKPEVVLMYGMSNINTLKQSIQDFFQGVKFKMIRGTKFQTPQHHRVDFNGTTILITTQIPALRHNRIETGFDWEEFGKRVKDANT